MKRMSLDLEFVDNVAVLRFDDGKRNVFSSDLIADFNAALDEVEARSAALCWIGREGCFSAGFDIKVVAGDDPQAAAALVSLGGQLAYRVLCFPRPVVCAVTGARRLQAWVGATGYSPRRHPEQYQHGYRSRDRVQGYWHIYDVPDALLEAPEMASPVE